MNLKFRIILMLITLNIVYTQCEDYSQLQCANLDSCEWVEDIEYGNCSNLSQNECSAISDCNWEYGCTQWGWWYDWCYTYGYECEGGTYQVDNGYCQEIELPECSEMNILQCNNDENCEWVEDIEIGDCSDITNSSECYQTNQCLWYNAGNYGYWYDNCYGGTYETDNSYCEEIAYQLGDINGDYSINILDVIETVNLIFDDEYNYIVDMNSDGSINILDIIEMIEIILDA